MSDPLFAAGDGNTPIDEDEAVGLRPSWIRTQGDLNDAEADNILRARQSIRSVNLDEVLDDAWLRELHRRMFGEVWDWAGSYRLTEKNIGIEPTQISVAVRNLVSDCRYWVEDEAMTEGFARFHHRLITIHPFPNGNGRHARAATDYLALSCHRPAPTWGETIVGDDQRRAAYLEALRVADRDPDDLTLLITFMMS